MNSLRDPRVVLVRESSHYASTPPFEPSEAYPEWPGRVPSGEDNPAFRAVRSALLALGLDREHAGTPEWNPLGDIINRGDRVIIKPNLVSHENLGAKRSGSSDTDCLVTHGSIIRAVADYAARALSGSGTIVIGDCPIQDTDWSALVAVVGLDSIVKALRERFPGVECCITDYRHGRAIIKNGVMLARVIDDQNSPVADEVELGHDSLLAPITHEGTEFGVSRYPRYRMRRAHGRDTHRYLIGRDFLEADVMINLPKMKSHMKAGITCALKNFVGINAHKDYLPHFRYGSPKSGGDEYPDGNWFWRLMWWFRHLDWDRDKGPAKFAFFAVGAFMKTLLPYFGGRSRKDVAMGGGGWYGNDTLWRTVLDVNRAFFHYDRNTKTIVDDRQSRRRYLAILDGLVGGHKESPLMPTPIESGVVLAATNPLAMDTVAAVLMGLDVDRLSQIHEGYRLTSLPLALFNRADIRVSEPSGEEYPLSTLASSWEGPCFEPSRGFRGHVERRRPEAPWS